MKKLYREGSVWRLTFVKVQPGKSDQYLHDVGPLREKLMAEGKKKGFILSHKTLTGLSAGASDWDFLFMVEYRNWAAIDGLRDKLESLNAAVVGSHEKVNELVDQREKVREIVGEKFMQELDF